MKKRNISASIKQIYGTGNFNPRRFDQRPRKQTYKLYLWGLIFFLFAIIAVILAGLYLFGSTPDSFTGDRVMFELQGSKNPKTAAKEQYVLKITNKEEVMLEHVELFIDWAQSASDSNTSAVHFISSEISPLSEANNTWELGQIEPNQTKDFAFSARFVGSADADIIIPFSLTVRPFGFNSSFTINHAEKFTLGDPTIDISIEAPSVAQSNSEIGLEINIQGDSLAFGNIAELIVSLDLPSSFSVISTDPEIDGAELLNEWVLAALPRKGEAYAISIKGNLDADVGSKNEFITALRRKDEAKALVEAVKIILIQSTDALISVSGSPAQGKKLQFGERADFTVNIENTSDYVMRNVIAAAALGDDALFKSDSLNIQDNGFFEAGNIIWDESTTDELKAIRPSNSVNLKFSFETSDAMPKQFSSDPVLNIIANLSANLGDKELSIESQENKINILADLDFDISGWYKSPEGIEWGQGPNPPAKGQETTYAIVFKLGPTTSGLKDLELTVPLGANVSFKDDVDYSVGELSYNKDSDSVIWRADKIPRIELPIEIRFMVGIFPFSEASFSDIIVDSSSFKIVDGFADEQMEFFANRVTVGDIE